MKPWLLMMLTTLLVGCAGTPQPKVSFYLLPNNPELSELTQPKTLPLLVVQPVELAAYLDTQGIVYRQSETQVIQARQNQWAQRLSPQLTQRITNDLRRKQSRYWPAPLNTSSIQQEHWKLQVRLQRFNGVYTGNAEVAGNWELLNPKGESMLNQEFSFQVPLKDTGYPALVEALSAGVDQLSTQIETQLVTR
ncbi:membrane integrity-associated transporter subunit PqiC [Vibrio cholerae]|uniref:PqiC family protein n=1 Tax=Vibrio cholerae TaxID=666 RepID=UPI00166D2DDD|nr:membrane integrity-associated transporter subunit PqiC [Vibrio cholerae]EGR3956721.1 membrane integrity-associated transporter subunit PqiC [Vibrio cholerae]MBD1176669.1 membrane integrity-associated transporter subunit PqiC [Vibrio cholerae]MCX9441243.1 membrane integrity-associated transporter subunit PqiC [Vibrio cholerae]MCX9444504.1 membrane integrity-associated transporter subunit PqiC [Vibrio cholerae]